MLIKVLRDRNLRILFAGQTFNMFGNSAMILTLSIWVVTLTGSPGAAGLIFVFFVVPTMAAPFWGLLVDRFPRRQVLIVNDTASAVLVSTLLTVHDRGDVWLIYLVALGYGISGQFYRAARGGLVHSIVPAEQLGDVNGVFSSLGQGLRIVGPLTGAGIFAVAGGHAVALLDAATFLLSVGSYLLLRNVADLQRRKPAEATAATGTAGAAGATGTAGAAEPAGPGPAAEHRAKRLVDELLAGARHVLTTPALRRIVLASALAFGCAGSVNVAIYDLIQSGLHRPPTFIGVLGAMQGVGSIAAGLLIGPLMRRVGEFAAASIGFLLNAVGLLMVMTAVLPAVFAGAMVAGLGLPWVLVAEITLLQRRTSKELQGRAIAASDAIIDIPYALGIGIAGLIIGTVGFRPVYLFDAAAFVVVGVVVARFIGSTRPEPAAASGPPDGSEQALAAEPVAPVGPVPVEPVLAEPAPVGPVEPSSATGATAAATQRKE